MDGVVRALARGDQVLGVKHPIGPTNKVLGRHRVDVVHEDLTPDVMSRDSEITAVVTDDDELANLLPLAGSVELLVDPAIEAEGRLSDSSA